MWPRRRWPPRTFFTRSRRFNLVAARRADPPFSRSTLRLRFSWASPSREQCKLLLTREIGPSLRFLWAEAKRRDLSDADAWRHVIAWARHRPAAWEVEDKRKKKGLAHAAPALGEHLARELSWTATGDVQHPWAREADAGAWRVRLNDFPDHIMYSR